MCLSAEMSMALSYSSKSRASATMPSSRSCGAPRFGTRPRNGGIHQGFRIAFRTMRWRYQGWGGRRFSPGGTMLSSHVMTLRQSFTDWRLPKELDGVLLLEDRRNGSGSMATQELHAHDELELHFL